MTFLEAALDILRREGRPLHYKDLTERALGKKLLTFVGRTPEVTMQTQLTAAVKKAPGNPFVRVKPGTFGLLRYPELSPEERAAAAPPDEKADRAEPAAKPGEADNGEGGRRRRRRGRGRRPGDPPAVRGADVASPPTDDGDADEPVSSGMSAEARAAALAETGVLEAGDDGLGDEEDEGPMQEDDDIADAAPTSATAPPDTDITAEAPVNADGADDLEDDETGADDEPAGPGEPLGPGRRRRRRRRRGRGEGEGLAGSQRETAGEGVPPPASDAPPGDRAEPGSGDLARAGGPSDPDAVDRQGPRRIMTPVDAALEILRGRPPGRGVHVRELADAASRRKLVHGEPNEAWRVMRTALAAEPRERLRAGLRPRVRAAGAGLFALARRPPDGEVEQAEQVFGDARRALRERTLASLERRIADLPGSAFEALARVLLQREGFGPATFVKRVEGTIYVEATRGRGARPSKCLIGLRSGGSSAGRAAIQMLREGIGKREQEEGLLMLAGRLADDAIAEWKKAGPPLEIADGAAMAETCVRHGVGVINTMVSVDFVDADFFADIAEG